MRKLEHALLPGKFDPTGSYRSAERTHLRAISFRILVHAEIESFIEDRSYELFDQAWNAWDNDRAPSRVLSALVAFSGHSMPTPPSRIGSPKKHDHDGVNPLLLRAKNHWKEQVHKKNNGVKEGDVLALLLPLGIDGSELETTLLADLTSFGGSRGSVAHRSSVSVISYADPKSEYDHAKQLVSALKNIDELIDDALIEVKNTRNSLTRR